MKLLRNIRLKAASNGKMASFPRALFLKGKVAVGILKGVFLGVLLSVYVS